jgi:hypothetical protein
VLKMNLKITKEDVLRVAGNYGYNVEFDSSNPGFRYINSDGTEEHYTVSEVINEMTSDKGSFYGSKLSSKERGQHHINYHVSTGFTMLPEVS